MMHTPIFVPDTECDNNYYSIYDKDNKLIGRSNRWFPLRDYLKKRYHTGLSGMPYSDDFYVVTEGWKNDDGADLIWKMCTFDGSLVSVNRGAKDVIIEDFFKVGPTSTATYDVALRLLTKEMHKMHPNEEVIGSMKSFVDEGAKRLFGKDFPPFTLEGRPKIVEEHLDELMFKDSDYLEKKLKNILKDKK